MSTRVLSLALLAATLGAGLVTHAHAGLANGSFEDLLVDISPTRRYIQTPSTDVPGWMTSATDGKIEIWEGIGFNGEVAEGPADGIRYAELNATQASTLFQDVTGIAANQVVGWKLSHRGRTGEDTMRLTITDLGVDATYGTPDDEVLFQDLFTDDMTWGHYEGSDIVALGNTVRFAFEAVSTANNNLLTGNFLDAADFGVGVSTPTPQVPEPGTWALMLIGLAATAGIARRARRC